MKKISVWGKNHPAAARLIIIVSSVLLIMLGIIIALLLRSLGIVIPNVFFLLITTLTLAGWLYYPVKNLKQSGIKSSTLYHRRKRFDLLLALCTFCLAIYGGNRFETMGSSQSLLASSPSMSIEPGDSARTYKPIPEFLASMKDANGHPLKWKERKKLLKQQIKAIKKANDLSLVAKIALIILAVGVACLLAYGVALLACSAACSGSGALAWIILILGAGAIVFLLMLAIRAIVGYKKRNKLFHR